MRPVASRLASSRTSSLLPRRTSSTGSCSNGEHGARFVAADQVASLHERGVDLRIDRAATAALPVPEGGAPAWRVDEPGVKPSSWQRFVDLMKGKDPRGEGWDEEN